MNHEPSPLLIASRNVPESWLVTVTVTPGSAPACESVTRPRTCDVPSCAAAGQAARHPPTTTAATLTRIPFMSALLENLSGHPHGTRRRRFRSGRHHEEFASCPQGARDDTTV